MRWQMLHGELDRWTSRSTIRDILFDVIQTKLRLAVGMWFDVTLQAPSPEDLTQVRATVLDCSAVMDLLHAALTQERGLGDMPPLLESSITRLDLPVSCHAWRTTTRPKQPFKLSHRFARKQTTRESVELATLQWVHWFNHTRLLKPIGGIPAAEAEANYWRQLASEAAQAAST